MKALLIGTSLAVALVFMIPVEATHADTQIEPYFSGGGFASDINSGTGIVSCDEPATLNEVLGTTFGCIGGADTESSHWEDGVPVGEQDFSQGYTQAVVVGQDVLFGQSISIWLCLPGQEDYNVDDQTDPFSVTCDNDNDVIVWSCGLGSTSADTNDNVDNPGFTALAAVTFIDVVAIDSTTNSVCLSSQGEISVTFGS